MFVQVSEAFQKIDRSIIKTEEQEKGVYIWAEARL